MDKADSVDLSSGVPLGLFTSRYLHALDPKKRLTIPSDWREQVGAPSRLFAMLSLDEPFCVKVYRAHDMAQRLEKFRRNSLADKKAQTFARTLGEFSDYVTWDTQGRIRVKDILLDKAGLTEQVALVGAFDHFELWNPERLQTTEATDRAQMADAVRYIDV